MKIFDKDLILICAFRYALGRRTYVVGTVVDEIVNNWDLLSLRSQALYQREIKEHEKQYGNLGMDMDKEQWYKILQLTKGECIK